jgi:four helix bundle protein
MSNEQKRWSMQIEGAKGQEICDRTRAFALRIIRLYQNLQQEEVGRILSKQLLRSGTSIGANVEEAQAAQSPYDFIHKMSIALKEARETRYWLTLLRDAELFPASKFDAILQELEQIIRIIFSIITNTRKGIKKQRTSGNEPKAT